MGNFIKTQSSFANGAVAPEFYMHDNINGLTELQNMDVLSGGGLTRRKGLASVTTLPESGRLIPFTVSQQENYILILADYELYVYTPMGTLKVGLTAPWALADIAQVQYAQRFGTLIFVHPNYQPMILQKNGNTFQLEEFYFSVNSDFTVNIPFMRFEDSAQINITISANSSGSNYATLTTNRNFWTENSVGTRINMLDNQWLITEYTNAKNVTARVNGGYSIPDSAVTDWRESVFSNRRGWPCSITFHQDRLVFGGSRDYSAGVWLSRVGQHKNFDVGTGLDDEAIFITLLSGRRQQICTVVSSDNLQILTTTGEWAISSKPLTPSSVDIKQHTSVGSIASHYLPPQNVEGKTVFIAGSECDIRELSLDELSENYNATDLCAYAKHLMKAPTDIAYNNQTHQLFVVMQDGTMAVLNYNSALEILAWGTYRTAGYFQSVAVIDGITYVVVERDNTYCLERFDEAVLSDANGIPFTCIASGLPLRTSGHNIDKLRVRKVVARVTDTKSLFINHHRITFPNEVYEIGSSGFSGDVSINLLGSSQNVASSAWSVSTTESLPLSINSITIYGFYTI